ncbi:MAG: leucine-rich repeat domain-containing protein [Eubacteriales bacterium]|nr:leucine-rich repeat domain-containing protein [Eubacteriales bacterium]
MNGNRIKVTLYNRTFKEIDMSDFTRITEGLFSNRDDIVAISFPEGVEIIASNAFENCRRLEKVEFPDSLKLIESEAFINCTSLKEADYGKNVTVAPDAFKGCINL